MKKALCILLATMMVIFLSGCNNNNAEIEQYEANIVGVWKLSEHENVSDYGLGIEFSEDGALYYGLTANMIEDFSAGKPLEVVLGGAESVSTMEYKIKNAQELEVIVHLLHGIKKQKETIHYSLTEDTLVYDGITYERIREEKIS